MRFSPSWIHLNLITSQRPHFLMSSQWGVGVQHMNLGRIQTFSPYLNAYIRRLCHSIKFIMHQHHVRLYSEHWRLSSVYKKLPAPQNAHSSGRAGNWQAATAAPHVCGFADKASPPESQYWTPPPSGAVRGVHLYSFITTFIPITLSSSQAWERKLSRSRVLERTLGKLSHLLLQLL